MQPCGLSLWDLLDSLVLFDLTWLPSSSVSPDIWLILPSILSPFLFHVPPTPCPHLTFHKWVIISPKEDESIILPSCLRLYSESPSDFLLRPFRQASSASKWSMKLLGMPTHTCRLLFHFALKEPCENSGLSQKTVSPLRNARCQTPFRYHERLCRFPASV